MTIDEPENSPINVGARLQKVRKEKGFSQRELAKKTDVTHSTISLIEQDSVSPSIGSLKKILDGLSITLADFFTLEVATEKEPRRFYSLADQPNVGQPGLAYFLIGADVQDRKLTMLREVLQVGADSGEEMLSHEGEEAGVVVQGQLELTLHLPSGVETQLLQAGEAYYFDSRIAHRFRNGGEEELVVVSANTPASF